MRSLTISCRDEPLHKPFETAARTLANYRAILVEVSEGGHTGRGEARGIPLRGETPENMVVALEKLRDEIEAGMDRMALQEVLPAGGARNALDCALWDLESKMAGVSLWYLTNAPKGPVTTAYTIGLDTPDRMVEDARAHSQFPILKVKIEGPKPSPVLKSIREARPHAKIIVDANQSLTPGSLPAFVDAIKTLDITFLEQPLPRGQDDFLEHFKSAISLCADESVYDRQSLISVVGRYEMINIKLDKTGGLTEALGLLQEARRLGLGVMVGNMLGSSLAMAPAMIIARQADHVDLDGPLLLKQDPESMLTYDGPYVTPNF